MSLHTYVIPLHTRVTICRHVTCDVTPSCTDTLTRQSVSSPAPAYPVASPAPAAVFPSPGFPPAGSKNSLLQRHVLARAARPPLPWPCLGPPSSLSGPGVFWLGAPSSLPGPGAPRLGASLARPGPWLRRPSGLVVQLQQGLATADWPAGRACQPRRSGSESKVSDCC